MSFRDKLLTMQDRNGSWLCIGLDTDLAKIPASMQNSRNALTTFNRAIIEATRDLVCAYKPNLAFYLAQGRAGLDALFETRAAIPRDIPMILDGKFGDIESSARAYAQFAFDQINADAATVSPYLGTDTLTPFLDSPDRAVFVLCHTSNPSAGDLQDALVGTGKPEALPESLYQSVARLVAGAKLKGEIGLVVGATYPEQLAEARAANAQAIFLIPGIGTQGGNLAEAVTFGTNSDGVGPIINASRSILYASDDADYAQAARAAAEKIRNEINTRRRVK